MIINCNIKSCASDNIFRRDSIRTINLTAAKILYNFGNLNLSFKKLSGIISWA